MAEDAARELPNLPLEDALQLVHLCGERGSPKYEKGGEVVARSLSERGLAQLAGRQKVTVMLAKLEARR
jgi:hypothetical protein